MLDDGILEIYRKNPGKDSKGKIVEMLEFYSKAWYGDINFKVSEYYSAQQAQSQVERKVRIHQDKCVCNKHVVIIDGMQYQVGRVHNGIEKGIYITDITLERVTAKYDIDGIL